MFVSKMRDDHVFDKNNMYRSIGYQVVKKIVNLNISKKYFYDMIEVYNHFEAF